MSNETRVEYLDTCLVCGKDLSPLDVGSVTAVRWLENERRNVFLGMWCPEHAPINSKES